MLSQDVDSRLSDLQNQITELATVIITLSGHLERICHTIDQFRNENATEPQPPNSTQPISDYRIAARKWQQEQQPVGDYPDYEGDAVPTAIN